MKDILRRIYHIPRDIKRRYRGTKVSVNCEPVFVLGNQKSGTSAIASLLGKATGLTATIDLPGICEPIQPKLHNQAIPFNKFIQKNKYDLSKDIIKEPSLTFLYDDLKRYFPSSQFVFIIRDPRDNIRSILNRLGLPGNLEQLGVEEQKILKKEPYDWMRVINGSWLGLNGDNYIEMLAERWNLAVDTYLKNSEDITLMKYEDFVEHKNFSISNLAKCIGLEVKNDIESHLHVNYQPPGIKSDVNQFFGEKNLARIEKICETRMTQFGYNLNNGNLT